MQTQQNSALKKINSTLNYALIHSLQEIEETVRDLQSFVQAATTENYDSTPQSITSYRIEPIQILYNNRTHFEKSGYNCFKNLIIQQVKNIIQHLSKLSTEEKKSYVFNNAITHEDLILCLQALYPNRPHEGICHGFALMGLQAILTKNLDQFDLRLKKLAIHLNNPTSNTSFEKMIQEIQQEQDFDLLAFFEGLELCSRGDNYFEIFNEETHPHSQLNVKFIDTILSLVSSQQLETVAINKTEDLTSRKKIIEVAETSGAYTFRELFQFFSSLEDTIVQSYPCSDPIALLIKNFCHSCVVGYDPQLKIWTFIDANRVFPLRTRSVGQLANYVKHGLNSHHYRHTFMHTSIFTTKLEFLIWSQIFLRWKNNPIFKTIHKIHQKAPLKNKARLLIASRYNHEESISTLPSLFTHGHRFIQPPSKGIGKLL